MNATKLFTGVMAVGLAISLLLLPVNVSATSQKNKVLKQNIQEIKSLTSCGLASLPVHERTLA